MFGLTYSCTSMSPAPPPSSPHFLSLNQLPTLPVCGTSPSPKVPLLGSQVQPPPYFPTPTCTTRPDFVETLSKVSLIQVPYFQTPRLPGVGALSRSAASSMPASGPPPPVLPRFTLKDDFRATFPKEGWWCDPPLKVRHTTQNKICFQDSDQPLGPSPSQLQSDFNVHPRTWSRGQATLTGSVHTALTLSMWLHVPSIPSSTTLRAQLKYHPLSLAFLESTRPPATWFSRLASASVS